MATVKKIAINRGLVEPQHLERKTILRTPMMKRCIYTTIRPLSNELDTCTQNPTSLTSSVNTVIQQSSSRDLSDHQYCRVVGNRHSLYRSRLAHLNMPWSLDAILSDQNKTVHYFGDPSIKKSRNIVDYINCRYTANLKLQNGSLSKNYGIKRLLVNGLLQEKTFKMDEHNKIFCSQWLSDSQIVFGTKCNKLLVMDLLTGRTFPISKLRSSPSSSKAPSPCGIHAIEISPSKAYLATGGKNTNCVAIYRFPTLDPVCLGENAHSDWMFDIAWLDDQYLVTGSRDSSLAIWRIDDDCVRDSHMIYPKIMPVTVTRCENAQKIRSLIFNNRTLDIVALSLNAQLHVLDAQSLRQKCVQKLPDLMENVCLAQENIYGVYAVGSKFKVTLFDCRTLEAVHIAEPTTQPQSTGLGVRSLSFMDNLMTIGTGSSAILFYDIRANKFLENNYKLKSYESKRKRNNSYNPYARRSQQDKYVQLMASKGWVNENNEYFHEMYYFEYNPAIYTHKYDASGTRLFAAGGPLPANLEGNFASLWT